MRRYLDLVDSEYLPVSYEESGRDYEHSSMPIRWAWVGLCVFAYRHNSFEEALIAPSKGAAYVAQKKMARAIKKSNRLRFLDEKIELAKNLRIIPHLSSDMPADEIEKIVKSSLLWSVTYDPQ